MGMAKMTRFVMIYIPLSCVNREGAQLERYFVNRSQREAASGRELPAGTAFRRMLAVIPSRADRDRDHGGAPTSHLQSRFACA